MDNELIIKKLERDILDEEVHGLVLKFAEEVLKYSKIGCLPDTQAHARKIVAFVREHLVDSK